MTLLRFVDCANLGSAHETVPTLQPCDLSAWYLWGALTSALSLARTCVSKTGEANLETGHHVGLRIMLHF